MLSILNNSKFFHQNYFSFPAAANFYGHALSLLEAVSSRVIKNAKLIGIIALATLGVAALCYLACRRVMGPSPALQAEFATMKKELLEPFVDDFWLVCRKADPIKIIVRIQHQHQLLTEAVIIPQIDQKLGENEFKKQLMGQVEQLFNKMKRRIRFDDQYASDFFILTLAGDPQISTIPPLYWMNHGRITIHQGQTSNFHTGLGRSVPLDNPFLQNVFAKWNIPFTPQLDAQDHLI